MDDTKSPPTTTTKETKKKTCTKLRNKDKMAWEKDGILCTYTHSTHTSSSRKLLDETATFPRRNGESDDDDDGKKAACFVLRD